MDHAITTEATPDVPYLPTQHGDTMPPWHEAADIVNAWALLGEDELPYAMGTLTIAQVRNAYAFISEVAAEHQRRMHRAQELEAHFREVMAEASKFGRVLAEKVDGF